METISYVTDTNGNKTGIILGSSYKNEWKLIEIWLSEPIEIRNQINIFIAKILLEKTTDIDTKNELNRIIEIFEQFKI